MRLHLPDAVQLRGGKRPEQHPDIRDVIHVAAQIQIDRTDGITADLVLRHAAQRRIRPIADRLLRQNQLRRVDRRDRDGTLARKVEHRPLRPRLGQKRLAVLHGVKPLTAEIFDRARPRLQRDRLHHRRTRIKADAAAHRQPEQPSLRHRLAAHADLLRVERGNVHKLTERPLHREPRRVVAVAQRHRPRAVISIFHVQTS